MNVQTLPAALDSDNWQRCYAAFLTHLWDKSHSSATVYGYRRILELFFSSGKHPSDYTRQDVEDFIHHPTQGQRSRGKAPATATINQRFFVIRSFYSYATEYTVENPADGRPMRLLQTLPPTTGLHAGQPLRSYKALSEEELEKFFSVIDQNTVKGARDYCIFLFYAITARRRSELASLTWSSIKPAILIDGNETRRSGLSFTFKGKGHSQEDDVQELPLLVKQSLDRYLEMSGRLATIKPEDPLFVATDLNSRITFDKSRPLNDESIARCLKYWACKAGLDVSRISIHSFRHTSARERFSEGEDILSLQQLLRHSSLQTTFLYLRRLTSPTDGGAKLLEARYGHL